MKEYFDMLQSAFQDYDPALLVGGLSGIAVFVLEMVLYSKQRILHKGRKKLEEAKRTGKTVVANLVSAHFEDEENDSGSTYRVWTASYEYVFRGIKGRKVIISHDVRPGPTMILYHDGKKVFTEREMSKSNRRIILLIIPVLVAGAVAWLLGYRP